AGRPQQAVEVPYRGPRHARAVGRRARGVRGRDHRDVYRRRTVVGGAGRPQVGQGCRRGHALARGLPPPRPAVPAARPASRRAVDRVTASVRVRPRLVAVVLFGAVAAVALLVPGAAAAGRAGHVGAQAQGVVVRQDLPYREVNGTDLKLDAYLPDGPGPYPGVVLLYGGGWVSGDKASWEGFGHTLAQSGSRPSRSTTAWRHETRIRPLSTTCVRASSGSVA